MRDFEGQWTTDPEWDWDRYCEEQEEAAADCPVCDSCQEKITEGNIAVVYVPALHRNCYFHSSCIDELNINTFLEEKRNEMSCNRK